MGKNIVIFFDGTDNSPNSKFFGLFPRYSTNVEKLYAACRPTGTWNPSNQIVLYLPGVGTTFLSSTVFGGIFGLGATDRLRKAYDFIAKHYNHSDGDKIFLFGFSRGAFIARSLACFICTCGILRAEPTNIGKFWYRIQFWRLFNAYRKGHVKKYHELIAAFEIPRIMNDNPASEDDYSVNIHFIGVWDTVGRIGLPDSKERFPRHWFRYHRTQVPPNVFNVRHALALHEMRPQFEPTLWTRLGRSVSRKNLPRSLEQVWFPGAHADVGGGYNDEQIIPDLTLLWMKKEACAKGLLYSPNNTNRVVLQAVGRITQHNFLAAIGSPDLLIHNSVEKPVFSIFSKPSPRAFLELNNFTNNKCYQSSHFHQSLVDYLANTPKSNYKFACYKIVWRLFGRMVLDIDKSKAINDTLKEIDRRGVILKQRLTTIPPNGNRHIPY